MAWSLLAAGMCFYIPGNGNGRLALIAIFIYSKSTPHLNRDS